MRPFDTRCLAFLVVTALHVGALRRKYEIPTLSSTTSTTTASATETATTTTMFPVFKRILHTGTASAARLPARQVFQIKGSPLKYHNGRWYERRDEEYLVDGVVTYWKEDGDNFMYWCHKQRFWAITNGNSFARYKVGGTSASGVKCLMTAHSRTIRTPSTNHSQIVVSVNSPGMDWKVYQNGSWARYENMGVVAAARTCGDRLEHECYNFDGCHWNINRRLCSIAWATYFYQPSYTDVSQGALGTCYLLAVFASVARFHPKLIMEAIPREQRSGSSARFDKDNIYQTHWIVAGKPITIAVDDWVPVNLAGMPVFVGAGFQKLSALGARVWPVVWPIILEKAWAKLHGNFKAVEAGRAPESFHALTGAPVVMLQHSDFEPDELWEQIKSSVDSSFPMYAATGAENTIGVAKGHAYGIIGAGTTHNGTRYVQLYNPWSYHRYTGTLASGSEFNIGDFRVEFDEFRAAYSYTAVAKVRAGYTRKSKDVSKIDGRLSTTFKIKVQSNNPFAVMLDWPSNRLLKLVECEPLNPSVSIEVVSPSGKTFTAQGSFAEGGFHADIKEGMSGEYKVRIFAQFNTKSWIDSVVVTAYTDDSVEFLGDEDTDETKVITLAGFNKAALNGDYVMRGDEFNGFETYGSDSYLLYYCTTTTNWCVVDKKTWSTMDKDKCLAHALGRTHKDILSPTPLFGWREYNGTGWIETPSAQTTRSRPAANFDTTKVIKLAGFEQTSLDGDYEVTSEKFNGFETYRSKKYVLYYCAKSHKWCVINQKTWSTMPKEKCQANALGRTNKGILSSSTLYGWREYIAEAWKEIPSAHSTWSPTAAADSLLQEYDDESEFSDMPVATCYAKVQERLASLNNVDGILKSSDGDDPLFPRNLSSIAASGATCGDTAQDISEACEKYNVWRRLTGPMGDEEPGISYEEV